MMQFFYNREVVVGKSEDGKAEIKEMRRDSFNPEMVIRTYEHKKGEILVLLNDGHEESRDVPVMNKKNQITGYSKARMFMQSEIYLNAEDTKRYREYFDIEPMMLLNNENILEAHMEEDLVLDKTEVEAN